MLHHREDAPRSSRSGARRSASMDICSADADLTVLCDCSQQDCVETYRSVRHAHNYGQTCACTGRACVHEHHQHTLRQSPPSARKGYVSCVVVVGTPQGGGLSVCRCASPAYPLSPTRCWRYRFSYLDFGGDCGWGRCKRPAEARCLPRCQSPHQGSRRLNPLLKLHIQTENDFPRSTKCRREFVLESHREAEREEKWRPQISLSEEDRRWRSSWKLTPLTAAAQRRQTTQGTWLSLETSEEQHEAAQKRRINVNT